MNQLQDAYFDGVVSPLLQLQWEQQSGKNVTRTIKERSKNWNILLGCVIVSASAIAYIKLYGFDLNSITSLVGVLLAVSSIGFIYTFFSLVLGKRPDKDFVYDCRELVDVLNSPDSPGMMGIEELKKRALDVLVTYAQNSLTLESDGDYIRAQKVREKFEELHFVLLKFDLVEKKWNKYFDQAKQEIADVKKRELEARQDEADRQVTLHAERNGASQ